MNQKCERCSKALDEVLIDSGYVRGLEEKVTWFELEVERLRRENISLNYQLNDLTKEN